MWANLLQMLVTSSCFGSRQPFVLLVAINLIQQQSRAFLSPAHMRRAWLSIDVCWMFAICLQFAVVVRGSDRR